MPDPAQLLTTAGSEPLRIATIGDSFSEGMGDEDAAGEPIGWAERVAGELARSRPVEFVNLAIRGKLLAPIVDEQLRAALALTPPPTFITFNGGGNDLMRPQVDTGLLAGLLRRCVETCVQAGIPILVLSGPNPGRGLPVGSRFDTGGTALTDMVQTLAVEHDLIFVNNFADTELMRRGYWSADRLHLNTFGHRRVAARVLRALGEPAPAGWFDPLPEADQPYTLAENLRFYRQHVAPWVMRRIRRRSSGDSRTGKYPTWQPMTPGPDTDQ